MRPARNATGSFSTIASGVEARELLVNPELEARRERRPAVGWLLRVAVLVREPRPRPHPDRGGPAHDRGERQQPGEQIESARSRCGEHLRPELGDEVIVDLLLRPAGLELCADERLHLLGERRARLVERLVAGRADEPGLDGGLRRVLARVRPERDREPEHEGQDREHGGERLHCDPLEGATGGVTFIAVRIPRSSNSGVAGPTMWPTWPDLFGGSGITRP